jgi:oligo-1,6-glucosidase
MFTVGECVLITPEKALSYIEEGVDELNLVFQFDHMDADNFLIKWIPRRFKLRRLKKALSKWQYALAGKAWNSLYFENHDQPRSINRFGSLDYRVKSAKMLATYIFYQQGTPFIYQGEEIGMTNAHYSSIDEYKDVETLNMYKLLKRFMTKKAVMRRVQRSSRDNARTPVQWNKELNAGFSKAEPWLAVNPNYRRINVEDSISDKKSILNFYKELIELRKKHKVIIYGDYLEHYKRSNKLAVYERNYEADKLLVVCNFSRYYKTFTSPYDLSEFELILNNYDIDTNIIEPYQTKVYLRKSN